MTAACPSGHESATRDYCDVCGAKLGGEGPPTEVLAALTSVVATPQREPETCPSCGATRLHGDLFCERCGHDFTADNQPGGGWRIIVAADRDQFESVVADGLRFPSALATDEFELDADEIPIGREATGGIDLGRGGDPGVSRKHAALVRLEDGAYGVVDRGSTNGTRLNDDPTPLAPDVVVPLRPGDRIRVGAWTTITVQQ